MMSSTIPRCNQCSRLTCWWGDYDPKTGWMGWCNICNAKWHWSEDAEPKISELVKLELVPESIVSIIYGYLAEDLAIIIKRLQEEAQRCAWEMFLVPRRVYPRTIFSPQWRRVYELGGFMSSAQSESAFLRFAKPMHKLMWTFNGRRTEAFKVMVQFLGAPDFNCLFHS